MHIIRPKLAWTFWGDAGDARGELLVSIYVRPHVGHDVVETIDEYMVGLGYRQFFWEGLQVEASLLGGVAWGTNLVDHREYVTPTLFGEVNAGYRFAFFEPGGFFYSGEDVGFYVTPQLGVLCSLGVADIGPRNGKADWFLQGALLLGLSF
ncbi:MAG: hypothetical protein KC619_25155 [Myxococcales bacterium]|nr:hypothetical protein [Myxococcales bacterium]